MLRALLHGEEVDYELNGERQEIRFLHAHQGGLCDQIGKIDLSTTGQWTGRARRQADSIVTKNLRFEFLGQFAPERSYQERQPGIGSPLAQLGKLHLPLFGGLHDMQLDAGILL